MKFYTLLMILLLCTCAVGVSAAQVGVLEQPEDVGWDAGDVAEATDLENVIIFDGHTVEPTAVQMWGVPGDFSAATPDTYLILIETLPVIPLVEILNHSSGGIGYNCSR